MFSRIFKRERSITQNLIDMAQAFSFRAEEAKATGKVFLWTVAAALVALLIDWMGLIEFPAQYAFVVPVVNTILYAIKEYVQER